MKKTIKLTETQLTNVIKNVSTSKINEQSDEEVKDIFDFEEEEDDDEDETNPLTIAGHFKENEFGEIELDENDIDELTSFSEGTRRRFIGVIYYDALIPMTDDIEYDKKIALGILENERKKMDNAETFLDKAESIHFRDKLY